VRASNTPAASPPQSRRKRSTRTSTLWSDRPRSAGAAVKKPEARKTKSAKAAEPVKPALPTEISALLNDFNFLPPPAIEARIFKICGLAANSANPHLPERAWSILARMCQALSFSTSN
jgi:hypothetical protein